ncbi:hypothetical protein [Neorhodopirellula pilleata]|uniref:Transmembrane protein n=1 Tax=Neorhodopirellula pilleata TaxID=2714738 RepID=A0A5C5ZWT4_9BACT|nr:hypothetical protein [Neorhodopirellula pilleata]TWT91488.1 hypothetical protein Pla100_53390 [Neorhodopirellula pilleata]
MIVPEYWAEAKDRFTNEQVDGKKGSRIIRRFGWSNDSQAAAQTHAESRVAEAIDRLRSGESVLIREPKVAYNGADGLPIREEVIERLEVGTPHEIVLTRNAYGSICLNTPNVLFADVDAPEPNSCLIYLASFLILFIGLFIAAFRWQIENAFWMVLFAAMVGSAIVGSLVHHAMSWYRGSPKQHARKRIETFARSHPDWSIRLYETPNGWRALVTHQTFDPRSDDVRGFFEDIGTDPVYARMCFNQNCFRARVTPKPWRTNMSTPSRLAGGVWPVAPERINERREWVRRYDRARAGYSSCRYVATLGRGGGTDTRTLPIDRSSPIAAVQRIHDDWSDAFGGKPIA